jgi:hypothetical protein
VVATNPAHAVRGPKHVVKTGKTTVLDADQARKLLDSIDTSTVVGLRDRALISIMTFAFARIGAVVSMRVEDYYPKGKRWWVRLHEKGGKRHEMPARHNLEAYLDAYIEAAGIRDGGKAPLFRSAAGRTGMLTETPMNRVDVIISQFWREPMLRTYARSAFASFSLLLITACTGKLNITDNSGTPLRGIPVATYELWIQEGPYSKLAKGGACDTSTPFQKIASIATGPVFYVQVEGSLFAKTSLDLKLNADGALSELSFNSESNLPDTLTGVSNILKTLPSLGIAGAGAPAPGPLPACDTGEVIRKITRFDEWKKAH